MTRISNLQIYCMLLLATAPLAYLVTPAVVMHLVGNNAWLAVLGAIIPGSLLIYVYSYILKKSTRPFPGMLEDCLGKVIGKILGFSYILVFLLGTAVTLRFFTSFIGSHIVPDTPLSVYIGFMLLTGYYAIRTGLENMARISEVVIIFGTPVAFLILLISLAQQPDIHNLRPLLYTSYLKFSWAVYEGFFIFSNIIAVLTLAYFSIEREKVPRTLFKVLITYIGLLTLAAIVVIIQLGTEYANLSAHPTFKIIRSITVGDFIQNIDAAFIALWIIGVFGAVIVKWFMACYVAQQVFALKDYRFVAAPTSLIIGFLTLKMGAGIIELQIIITSIIPLIYGIFYISIPLLVFFILLFKPNPDAGVETGLKAPPLKTS